MVGKQPPDILKKIVAHKKTEIAVAKQTVPLIEIKKIAQTQPKSRGFVNAIKKTLSQNKPVVIAEIKKASPSQGVLCQNFDPKACAISYQNSGASCLSVLTDEKFFQGSAEYLRLAQQATTIPVLRKDFIVEPYQVFESKAMNADCILLIAAVLNLPTMQELTAIAQSLDLDVLVEVHNLEELEISLKLDIALIGINNRNLHTFATSLQTTIELLTHIPNEKIVVTESGILQKSDVRLMQQHQVNVFLVGEAFMKTCNPGDELKRLFFE